MIRVYDSLLRTTILPVKKTHPMASSSLKTWQPVRFTLAGTVGEGAQTGFKEGPCAVIILNQPLEQQKDLLIRICRDEGD